jgi:hypothetical protein
MVKAKNAANATRKNGTATFTAFFRTQSGQQSRNRRTRRPAAFMPGFSLGNL